MQIDHDEIMRRCAAIAPTLTAHSRECDAARQLVPQSMAAMLEAGMFRIPQPARTGGYELPLRTLADAVTALSEACPSAGWVLMVMGAHHWCMGSFPETAQDEVFGSGGLVAGTLSWQGSATPVSGGFRVSGRWQFCSGVDHSNWVMLGCADSETRGPLVHVVVPRGELEIDDTWHVMGLQGTGSKDVVAHEVFVPEHRTIDTRTLFRGASPYASQACEQSVSIIGGGDAFGFGRHCGARLGEICVAAIYRTDERAARHPDRRTKGRARADAGAIGRGRRRDPFAPTC